ncbi:MAG: DUF2807 domain-containing protein, partial [Bacteroidota bacterium]
MKTTITFLFAGLLGSIGVIAQNPQTFDLGDFDELEIKGHVEVYISNATRPTIEVAAETGDPEEYYDIGIKNNVLHIRSKDKGSSEKTPKIKVFVAHPGLESIQLEGVVDIFSDNRLEQEALNLEGSGIISGNLELNVEQLLIHLEGISKLTVSGEAAQATLGVQGIGKIRAKELFTENLIKRDSGISKIDIGSKITVPDGGERSSVVFECESCTQKNTFKISGPEDHTYKKVVFPLKKALRPGNYTMTYWQNKVQQIHLPFTV